ncbi:minor capsid protein [Flavobacterium psychroterrae]|uniref:Minor capsid protein n=1 Tax=Flavobacterium psychroterrae TaxID=2133767 RepID=A0ABS5PIA6_9FLAO|nr:phage minor head protein [Flavobacterium psychroterrae]MBS7234059.1 minor capsid protein [Flavobacterium psychroterrae]
MAQKDKFKGVLNTVEKAFKKLHDNGSYNFKDLAKTAEYKNLIKSTAKIFDSAITDNDVPEQMSKSLKQDTFIFSELKTNAQLFEASQLLLTEENTIKPFSQFSKDIQSIKENYNQNYLEAEYQFAVSSAQSAANWANVSEDYDLQYRTANDSKVRDSHAKLQDITLPSDDPFWISYYPPNGWRCRCTAPQVRKGKYKTSDSEKANAQGEKATSQIDKDGKNKLAIFRFNPGMAKKVFPPEHPYNKVKGAKEIKKAKK